MPASSGRRLTWRKHSLHALGIGILALGALVVLGTALWLRPYLSARYLVWQLGRQDDASLSRVTLDVNVNTYDHGVPAWCGFDLKEATLTMLRTRYGASAIKVYVHDKVEEVAWEVVQIDKKGVGPHFFWVTGGNGTDNFYFELKHEPGTFDLTDMRLLR